MGDRRSDLPSDLAPEHAAGPEDAARLQGRHVTLVDADGAVRGGVGRADVEAARARGETFWLDIHEPTVDDLQWLARTFSFHPLAVEDMMTFGQRPKADVYEGHALVVVYGASGDDDGLVEVHCFVGPGYLVTVHRDDCLAFPLLHRRIAMRGVALGDPAMALYLVADALTDSFFPMLEVLDDRIDTVQEEIFRTPDDSHLHEVFAMKQRLVAVRRVISPQRDVFAQIASGNVDLPGGGDEARRYFRDVYDHLIRLADMVDTHRDLLTGSIEVYMSTVANRRDQVMKQLTVIATIFMPITYLTGYFGQNFGYMVDNIITGWQALVLGTALQVLTVVGILWFFRRRGWTGGG